MKKVYTAFELFDQIYLSMKYLTFLYQTKHSPPKRTNKRVHTAIMSKQTAAVAVKGGSGVDSSSPPANVIKLWKEVEDKLLLQKGKACLEIKHIHKYMYMSS